jgi:hypothetical protein
LSDVSTKIQFLVPRFLRSPRGLVISLNELEPSEKNGKMEIKERNLKPYFEYNATHLNPYMKKIQKEIAAYEHEHCWVYDEKLKGKRVSKLLQR